MGRPKKNKESDSSNMEQTENVDINDNTIFYDVEQEATDCLEASEKPSKSISESLSTEGRESEEITGYLNIGSTLLNLGISGKSNGGIPYGRVVSFHGQPSTGKSIMCKTIMGDAIRKGGTAIMCDIEGSFDFDRAKDVFGCDVGDYVDDAFLADMISKEKEAQNKPKNKSAAIKAMIASNIKANSTNFACFSPETVESLWDDYIDTVLVGIEKGEISSPVVMCVDSITAITSAAELKRKMEEGTFGGEKNKKMSEGFRKYIKRLNSAQLTIVFVDQVRANLSGMGKSVIAVGSKAAEFMASIRVNLTSGGKVNVKNIYGIETLAGIKVTAFTEKNKTYSPCQSVPYICLWDFGLDDVRCNIEFLLGDGLKDSDVKQFIDAYKPIISRSGSWYKWGEESMGQGIEDAISYVESNNLENALIEEVERIWNQMHTIKQRKKRF